MYNVLVVGAGKIGSLIACLFAESGDYQVHLADTHFLSADVARLLASNLSIKTVTLDVNDNIAIKTYLQQQHIQAIVSCLPYYLNVQVAHAALESQVHYFDLTEDTATTAQVKVLAQQSEAAMVPQCGLAPGFISIVANSLLQDFDTCYQAKLRVGALPQRSCNRLQYALTWSTDGLINGYGNPCHAIEAGRDVLMAPLEGLEPLQIDGSLYEAFNTSGGIGSLAEIYSGKIQNLNYKTIRYPGHCEKMRFLMQDLHLNEDRAMLKSILERALPKTYQDVVIVYVSADGLKNGVYSEISFVKKIYPLTIAGLSWSAIQVSTSASMCAVVDMVLAEVGQYRGLVLQEQFNLNQFLTNRFGQYYA